jgi:hypothetical protein
MLKTFKIVFLKNRGKTTIKNKKTVNFFMFSKCNEWFE